jgi:hypothetical protein
MSVSEPFEAVVLARASVFFEAAAWAGLDAAIFRVIDEIKYSAYTCAVVHFAAARAAQLGSVVWFVGLSSRPGRAGATVCFRVF